MEAFDARTVAGRIEDKAGGSPDKAKVWVEQSAEPVCVLGDESALMQVLLNLLDNAWKYSRATASGGDRLTRKSGLGIEVRADLVKGRRHAWMRTREWLRVSVQDHGIGIPRKEIRKIFRRFYRVLGPQDEPVSGVGLGLALCQHVIRHHGGWIEAQSTVGEGSRFTFFLPILKR